MAITLKNSFESGTVGAVITAANSGSTAIPESFVLNSSKGDEFDAFGPATLTAVAGDSQITLNWTTSTGADSYDIYRSSTAGTQGSYYNFADAPTTTFTDTGLTNGTTYYYTVVSLQGAAYAVSNQVAVTPTGVVNTNPPSAPTNVVATAGNGQVTLTWTAGTNATSYAIHRQTTSGVGPSVGTTATTSYIDTGLTNGTTYYYVITSTNSYGTSNSSVVSAAPTAGGTGGGRTNLTNYTLVFDDDFATTVAEGSMFTASGDHAAGVGVYNKWGAETYLTTYGSQSGTNDYYGINNMSVVSGIAGANGNCLKMRLYIDSSGKKVGACPYPNLSGTVGTDAAASAILYGRYEARFMSTSTHGWKTAWLWWPKTWNWTNEVDFPEGDLDSTIGGFVHQPNNASANAASVDTSSVYTAWHTAAVEWSPGTIKFILDGATILTATGAKVASEPLFWQMQTENSLSGGSSQPTGTALLYVDYVSMWTYHS